MAKFLILIFMSLAVVCTQANQDVLSEAISEFPIVIYVNKSVRSKMGQKIVVFKEGRQIITEKVSTGREQFEAERFSSTPKGFFTPTFLVENHVASKSGIPMPYSIFFNENIALHQAVQENRGLNQLGMRASSGCVRLSDHLAPKLFQLVSETGMGRMPIISEDGKVSVTRDGEMYKANRYMTLIIVDDSTAEYPPLLVQIKKAFQLL